MSGPRAPDDINHTSPATATAAADEATGNDDPDAPGAAVASEPPPRQDDPAHDDAPAAEPSDAESSCPAWCRLPSGHNNSDDSDPHYRVIELMELPAIRRAAGRRVQIEIWQYPAEPPVICLVDDGGDDDLLPPMLPADALALYLTVAGAGAAASALTDAAPAWMGRDSRQRRERRRGRRGPTTTPAMPDTTTRRTRGA